MTELGERFIGRVSLKVEKAAAILIAGQWAGIEAAEEAIAAAGYDVVSLIAEGFGQELQEKRRKTAEASELAQDISGCIGAGKQALIGEFEIEDDVDGIEVVRVGGVASEDTGCERALQGSKTENCVAIAAEDELDEAVAESADAVVEKDGVGHGRD